jgi:hypothetical protein
MSGCLARNHDILARPQRYSEIGTDPTILNGSKRQPSSSSCSGAHVHVLSIIPSGVADAAVIACARGYACLVDDSQGYRKLLDESLEWLRGRAVVAEGYLATVNIIDQVLAYAKRLALDLIVLGHYPRPLGVESPAEIIPGRAGGMLHLRRGERR